MVDAPERIWARFPEHLPINATVSHIHEGTEYVRANLYEQVKRERLAQLAETQRAWNERDGEKRKRVAAERERAAAIRARRAGQ